MRSAFSRIIFRRMLVIQTWAFMLVIIIIGEKFASFS